MRSVILTMVILSFCILLGCSKNELKGTVINGNNKTPIQGVAVTLEGTNFITLTDSNGWYYLFDFPDGDYSLKFHKEEFEPKTLSISLKNEDELQNDVELFLDRPTDELIQDFVRNRFRSSSKMGAFSVITKKYFNLQILNQWSDENLKGYYYVKVSFDYEDNWFASSCIQTWAFKKQGKIWQVGDYPVQKDCVDRGGKGLFQ